MKQNKSYLFLLILILITFSCKEKKQVEAGVINKENIYENDEVGWKMPIPEGWKIMSVDQRNVMNERGRSAIEDAVGEVDSNGLKNLLAFQKDKENIFNSTSQPFIEEHPGEWLENNENVKYILTETYAQNGILSEASETTIEKIGGIDFHVFHIKVKLPNNKTLTQYMYSTLINGLDFGVNVNYSDEKYGQEMLGSFRKSQFKKPVDTK